MAQTNVVEKIKTYISYSITFLKKNHAVYEITKNILWSREGLRQQNGRFALHAAYQSLQTQNQDM